MNTYLKTGIKCAVLTLWSATLAVGVLLTYEHWRPSMVQADLDLLEQKLQVALLEQSSTYSTALSGLTLRLTTLEDHILEFDDELASISGRQSSQESSLTALENDLDQSLNQQMQQLESRLNTKFSRQQSLRSSPIQTTTTTNKAVQKPVVTIKAPFTLYDVQKRGLAYLAIVGNPGATNLSQLSALQEGQSYQQWRLIHVEPGRIELEKGEHRIEMEVRS